MVKGRAFAGLGVAGALLAAVVPATTASAAGGGGTGVTVVARHLSGPEKIAFGPHGGLYVAESQIGQVTNVNLASAAHTPFLTGLGPVAGVDVGHDGTVYAVVGVASETGAPKGLQAKLLVAPQPGHQYKVTANLYKYELAHNPDGQSQKTDTLSNPFGVLRLPGRTLVADAGGNDVIAVSDSGKMSTLFAPRNIVRGLCKGAKNNDPQHPGCDSVPTDVAEGPDGNIYVSGLGSLVPHAARIWKLSPSGKLLRTYGNLTGIDGLTVGPDGSIYASDLLAGAPEGPPPAGFDPSKVGRIVRIAPDGTRSIAQVTMPSGLTFHDGKLYAGAWSIAAFVGLPADSGQVVRVDMSAFR